MKWAARCGLRWAWCWLLLFALLLVTAVADRHLLFDNEWLCSIDNNYTCVLVQRPSSEDGEAVVVVAAVTQKDLVSLSTGTANYPVAEWAISEYTKHLAAAPVLTKAITSAVVGWAGDLLAQWFEMRSARSKSATFDWLRSIAVVVDGLILTGPGLHFLYGSLEHFVPTADGDVLAVCIHVLFDEFLFDPMFVALFFVLTGLIEGKHLFREILPHLRREYWTAVTSLWGLSFVFIPLQYVSFKFCPLEFRVLVVNLMDVLWTAVMSFFSHKDVHPSADGKSACDRD